MEPFFNPKSIAIVGASREPTKPGHVILRNFLKNKKRGGKIIGLEINLEDPLF